MKTGKGYAGRDTDIPEGGKHMGMFYNSKGYYEDLKFSGGKNNGTILYNHDIYRVKPAAFEEVSYCTNMKWMVEALESFAYERLQSGDYETYFEKMGRAENK